MAEVVEASTARPRVLVALLTTFALLALVLAGVGVYGVMGYTVEQRTREVGVRMALGATPGAVLRMILGRALTLVAAGVVAGLVLAALLGDAVEGLLFQTQPLDPAIFAGTAAVLMLVAGVASLLPALRSTRIAPVEALRAE
jgi:ABC-type antimicrobial peptide transport system permease subunit